jgi:hypothetical protein
LAALVHRKFPLQRIRHSQAYGYAESYQIVSKTQPSAGYPCHQMDHILVRESTTLEPVKVPFVCKDRDICSKAQFIQWPFDFDLSFQRTLKEVAADLQSWLYFGLLSAFLDEDIRPQKILKKDPNWPYRDLVDSCFVEHLIQAWCTANQEEPKELGFGTADEEYLRVSRAVAHIANQELERLDLGEVDEEHLQARRVAAHTVFNFAVRKMNLVIDHLNARIDENEVAHLWDSEAYAVIYAIDVLIDMLESAVKTLPHLLGTRNLERRSLAASVRVYRDSIARTGRCLSLGWRLQPSSTDWYRILFLPLCGDFQDHRMCTGGVCLHTNPPSNSEYKTKHVDTCHDPQCESEFLGTDQEVLKQCILEDRIPLVRCYEGSDQKLRLEIVKGDLLSDYTAISHVWAGGLGNPIQTSLPKCQLRRLMEIIGDLPLPPRRAFRSFGFSLPAKYADKLASWASHWKKRPALFWLDTLCIPVADEYKDQRKKAIDSMAQLYAGARKVLVLDPYLQLLPSDVLRYSWYLESLDPDLLELYIRVSPWMGRSWPLQEGAVAQNLLFRLQDRTVMLEDDMYQKIGLPSLRMLEHNAHKMSAMPHIYDSRFTDVWNALVKRSTKESADLHGIFATMVNLGAGEILELPKAERMKAIIRGQSRIPLSLFYQPNDDRHNSWVPQFPSPISGADVVLNLHGSLLVTDEGLVVEDLFETSVLLFEGELPSEGVFKLQVQYTYIEYKIQQDSPIVKPTAPLIDLAIRPDPPETLFLLTHACFGKRPGYQGARFSVLSRNSTGIRLRFEAALSWWSSSVQEPNGFVCNYLRAANNSDYKMLVELGMSKVASRCLNACDNKHGMLEPVS